MIEAEVRVIGLRETVRRFGSAKGRMQGMLVRVTRQVLEHLRAKLARYPRPSRGPVQFVSPQQRLELLIAIRKGEITVPYRRTGTLGRRWTIRVQPMVGGARGVMGNVTPYAPLVQGAEQAGIHRGNWRTVEQVVREEEQAIVGMYVEGVKSLF